mmetsp:Transcript_18082/g.28034  ORF Transcript_18082/g.28034 Transcript_18082/m.28034 type:complete len:184 (+) Transcript_18082:443-994(+)
MQQEAEPQGIAVVQGLSKTSLGFMINQLHLFKSMKRADKQKLIKMMTVMRYGQGYDVCSQGTKGGDALYVIYTGSFSIWLDGEQVATLGTNDFFGEMSMVFNENRSASVACREPNSVVLVFERKELEENFKHARTMEVDAEGIEQETTSTSRSSLWSWIENIAKMRKSANLVRTLTDYEGAND